MGDNDLIILIGLAAVAGFLLLKLRGVLGERDGYEDSERLRQAKQAEVKAAAQQNDSVVTPMPARPNQDNDDDIFAYAEPNSELGQELRKIKEVDPSFRVSDFMSGAKIAYEQILTDFEAGEKDKIRPFLDPTVFTAFSEAIDQRSAAGLTVDMRFIGYRSAEPTDATLDDVTKRAEITVRYVAEVVTATRNAQGDVVEGDPSAVQKISDKWTFAREMSSADPNWTLIATGG